jgi:pimeloyl-ACP methyl ester carboxylesterase
MTSSHAFEPRLHASQNHSWLPAGVWPFRSFTVESGDDVLAVSETGEGPAVLLVHVGTWSFLWRDLMKLLAPDFRCITLDAPGNGRTQSRLDSPVTMERASRGIAAVIKALNLRDLTLVLHDLGGPTGIGAVADTPERIRGVVAMNCFAWKPDHAGLRKMLAIIGSGFMRESDVATGLIPRITATAFGIGSHLDQQSRDTFRAGMDSRGIRSFRRYLQDALRCDELYEKVARALAGPLAGLPLLTIFGQRNDPFGFQPRWKQLFPHARDVVVLKGNHFPMCDAPDLCARAIRDWQADCTGA